MRLEQLVQQLELALEVEVDPTPLGFPEHRSKRTEEKKEKNPPSEHQGDDSNKNGEYHFATHIHQILDCSIWVIKTSS